MQQKPAKSPQPWEQLADPETGELVTRVPFDTLSVPERVDSDRDYLKFAPLSPRVQVRVPASLLERFLSATTDERRYRFAQRFGCLLEPNHAAYETNCHRERFETWRGFQWEYGYLLGLTAALREGADIVTDPREEYEGWNITLALGGTLRDLIQFRAWSEITRSERRDRAASVIRQRTWFLVNESKLRPGLVLSDRTSGKFRFVLQGGNWAGTSLLGALTGQFLAAATGSGFASCSACGNVFVPKRRQPAFGKRRYCPRCGRAAALRHAKAEFRKREREKRLAQKGGL